MNNFKNYLFLLTILLCFWVIKPASAQTIPQNASSINVDDLSDQQITQLILQAQKAGLTDDQLLQQAQSRGMSGAQVQKLQSRIKDLRSKNKNGKSALTDSTSNIFNKRKSNYKDTVADSTNNKLDFFYRP